MTALALTQANGVVRGMQAQNSAPSVGASSPVPQRGTCGLRGALSAPPRADAPAVRQLQGLLQQREQQMQRHQSRIQRLEERFGTNTRVRSGVGSGASLVSGSDDDSS